MHRSEAAGAVTAAAPDFARFTIGFDYRDRERMDALYPARLELPDGMTSGFYKYIVFDEIECSTGRVYDQPCHRLMGHSADLPNSDWVAQHHVCVPLYYQGGRSG